MAGWGNERERVPLQRGEATAPWVQRATRQERRGCRLQGDLTHSSVWGRWCAERKGGWGEGEEADVQMDTQTEPSGARSDGRKGGGGEVGVRGGEGVVEETRGVDRGRGRQAQDSLRSQPTHTQRAIAHAMAVHVGGWRQRGGWLAWRGEQGESARMLWLPVGLVEEESLGEASFQDMLSREVVGDRGCAARV